MGTGYARPLVVATDASQFIGVYLETNDNSQGVAGTIVYDPVNLKSSFVRIARRGIFAFTQTGITVTSIGQCRSGSRTIKTVTTTPGRESSPGLVVAIDEQNGKAWVDIENAVRPIRGGGLRVITADGAIAPHTPATYMITKAGVAAMTLAAPTTVVDDGLIITVVSSTANAHTRSPLRALLQDRHRHGQPRERMPPSRVPSFQLMAYARSLVRDGQHGSHAHVIGIFRNWDSAGRAIRGSPEPLPNFSSIWHVSDRLARFTLKKANQHMATTRGDRQCGIEGSDRYCGGYGCGDAAQPPPAHLLRAFRRTARTRGSRCRPTCPSRASSKGERSQQGKDVPVVINYNQQTYELTIELDSDLVRNG
jgi:hypothetical protein